MTVRRCKLLEQNFGNFIISDRFFQKTQKLLTKISGLATSGRHNYAMITDRRKITAKLTIYKMSILHFTVIINSNLFPGLYTLRTRKVPTQIFGNVRCPILRVTTKRCSADAALRAIYWTKSRLNGKLKISNTADNAGITQSQARDTRYRLIQELNRSCVSK